jgi:DNA-binding transcriptional ArsR family regulator
MSAARVGSAPTPDGVESAVLDLVFAAIADPIRRAILHRLDDEELLVSELAAPFDISLQAVSKHIQVLVKAGLVTQERTGRISRCRLTAGPMYEAAIWINHYSKYWQTQFDTLAALLQSTGTENRASASKGRGATRKAHR